MNQIAILPPKKGRYCIDRELLKTSLQGMERESSPLPYSAEGTASRSGHCTSWKSSAHGSKWE